MLIRPTRNKLTTGAHPSAIKFNELGVQVIGETAIPGPDIQVYQQVPTNGLYSRQSGRLLTSQDKGDFVERARKGFELGVLFELQRAGKVTRNAASVVTDRWVNPVHSLRNDATGTLVAIRWIDEEGLHNAIPQNQDRVPFSVTVQSWSKDTVAGNDFAVNPSGECDSTVKSREIEDLALRFIESAIRAYEALKTAA
jgi:hypothetical protein